MVIHDYHIHTMIFTSYSKVAYFKIFHGENLFSKIPCITMLTYSDNHCDTMVIFFLTGFMKAMQCTKKKTKKKKFQTPAPNQSTFSQFVAHFALRLLLIKMSEIQGTYKLNCESVPLEIFVHRHIFLVL